MFAASIASFIPLLGCGLMMLVCMGPMLSQRVRGWFHMGASTPESSGVAPDAGTAAEVAELRAQRAEAAHDGAAR